MTAIVVLVATAVATLVLARRYHLDAAAAEVAIIGGLPGLYLVWAAYRDDRRAEAEVDSKELSVGWVADELAVAIKAQWEAEAAVRMLNDPYPLPVRWVAAGSDLAADWPALVTLATTGAGWPAPSSSCWAASSRELEGQGEEIADVLGKVPTGRLVILGEPGTGKTMLLVRLLLDLLGRREPGGPVPVLVSLASWDPAEEGLHNWLITRLALDYHALAAPDADARGTSWIRAMLARGQILPILYGLDEMPKRMRGPAITRINDALRPGERLVLSSRGAAYRRAVRPEQGPGGALQGAAVIGLCSLEPAAVRRYLLDAVIDRTRWEPVLAALGTEMPVGQAMTTPLMVALARAIYSPRPGDTQGEYAGSLPDPADLCDPAMTDRSAVAQHLFDAFIPATYSQAFEANPCARRWKADKAERWFAFLAGHIEHTVRGADFAWWQLESAIPRTVSTIAAVLAATLGFSAAFVVAAVFSVPLSTRFLAVPMAGLAACGAAWLSRISRGGAPMSGVRWRVRGIHRPGRDIRIRLGLAILLIIPLPGLIIGAGPLAGLGWTLVCLFTLGLRGVYGGIPVAASPQVALYRSRHSVLIFWGASLVFGPAIGLAYGYVTGLVLKSELGSETRQLGLIIGLVTGLVFGLGFGLVRYAWPRWGAARLWLAFTGRLPWALMSFLEDAHKRGILRQAGAFYQFRHVDLQRRLAMRSPQGTHRRQGP